MDFFRLAGLPGGRNDAASSHGSRPYLCPALRIVCPGWNRRRGRYPRDRHVSAPLAKENVPIVSKRPFKPTVHKPLFSTADSQKLRKVLQAELDILARRNGSSHGPS